MKKLNEWILSHKVLSIIIIAVLVLAFLISGAIATKGDREDNNNNNNNTDNTGYYDPDDETNVDFYYDEVLLQQEELRKKYGTLPSGLIWDYDGGVNAVGDKNLTAEEVVYTYINGIKTLDMDTAQKFSRKSSVIKTFSTFFDSDMADSLSYKDSFMRNIYKYCLLSLQVQGVESNTLFAANKQVFTIRCSILDLTSKDFWEENKDEIFENMAMYDIYERDATKADIYLYDFIDEYYRSENAVRRDVVFDITVEKFPSLDSGWLVTIDKDIDMACNYTDGTLVINYIKETYVEVREEYRERILNRGKTDESEVEEPTEETDVETEGSIEESAEDIQTEETSYETSGTDWYVPDETEEISN